METWPEVTEAALAALQEVYDSIPSLNCQGHCWQCCGAIDMSPVERSHIADLGVEIPVMTDEWSRAWENDEPAYCPAFSLGAQGLGKPGCTVYDRRPTICRLWGVSESMPCPYGCKPEKTLTDREGFEILFRAARAGNDPRLDARSERNMRMMLDTPEGAEAMAAFLRKGNT